jgi:translation initiation factor 6
MKIDLGTIRQSPFVGIFSLATEKAVILPKTASKKEEKKIENLFGTETIKASIANSSLIGVLAAGNRKGLIASSIIEDREQKELEEKGIKVQKMENITAIGNHLAVNDSKGICSKTFTEKQRKKIEKFLSVKLMPATIASTDIVGASTVATNKGFLINKMASDKEAEAIEKHFGIPGAKATANAGDCFIKNSIIANSQAALAGQNTTGFELTRLDEGLRG